MSYSIVASDKFKRELKKLSKKYASLKQEYADFIDSLEETPTQGTSLGKDCYKIRLAISSKGKGKRGGGRVITCVKIVQETVYLLAVYDKAERDSVSDAELNDMLAEAGLGG
jgi:mRNA-degrading endonuclease RelE of RelBE toxin-antitoxin system